MTSPFVIFRALVLHRHLLFRLTLRSLEAQYKGSFLGLAWTLIQPLVLCAVYAFVFVFIFNGRFGVSPSENRFDYAIGIFLGLTFVQCVTEVLAGAASLITQNPNYVKKVVFPLELLPVSMALAACVRSAVGVGIIVVVVSIVSSLTPAILWLVPLFLALIAIVIGISWLVSAVGVFFRDIGPLTQVIGVVLTFTSGAFYSINQIPPQFTALRLNPLLQIVSAARGAALWGMSPEPSVLLGLFCSASALLFFGALVFAALRPSFADVL
ncbi:ABC transporter permease [Nibricoccus sp. IMCC34717]|uniref:ABC transporter permease n=1 Tax=Nibricoccus sp. IMCC34717 TaxID=3034021 RepID=UPI00384BDB17